MNQMKIIYIKNVINLKFTLTLPINYIGNYILKSKYLTLIVGYKVTISLFEKCQPTHGLKRFFIQRIIKHSK